jgi:probable biosynthetic protein (TIGR04098 family)
MTWHDYSFVVQMPQQAPGGRLSEIELTKLLGAFQWESIARELGVRPSQIVNAQGDRLYSSFIDVELRLGGGDRLDTLGEDVRVHVHNRVRFFAKKFVEGMFVLGPAEIPRSTLEAIDTRADLLALPHTCACVTNALISRDGENTRLRVFKPAAADGRELPEMRLPPPGIAEQSRVHAGEPIGGVAIASAGVRIEPLVREPIVYDIVPESDLNGAGLLYFARYPAMMDYAERVFLTQRVDPPVSTHLVACLATQHRRIFYFANASPEDRVLVRAEVRLLPATLATDPVDSAVRIPFELVTRMHLHRGSDKVLMASALVRKALVVPSHLKHVLFEAQRMLQQYAP